VTDSDDPHARLPSVITGIDHPPRSSLPSSS
jgi:hypothetical protein